MEEQAGAAGAGAHAGSLGTGWLVDGCEAAGNASRCGVRGSDGGPERAERPVKRLFRILGGDF